jgi:hypothetical protein
LAALVDVLFLIVNDGATPAVLTNEFGLLDLGLEAALAVLEYVARVFFVIPEVGPLPYPAAVFEMVSSEF